MNSRCFDLHRTYSTSFNSTNVGEFFWSWIQKTDCSEQWEKEKESPCAVFTDPSQDVEFFLKRRSRGTKETKRTKRVMHV